MENPRGVNYNTRISAHLALCKIETIPTLEYQAKHQLLLPSKNHVAKLFIMDVPESVGHLGQEYVLTNLRQKYWIVQRRTAVRRVLGNCLTFRLVIDLPYRLLCEF